MTVSTLGRAHCLRRLSGAATLAALHAVWDGFGVDAQADDEIKAHYLRCQRSLSK